MDFPVVGTKANNGLHFFLYQITYQRIIVPFINSTKYQYGWLFHTLKCIPGTIHICRLAVVNKFNSPDCIHMLHPVLESLERLDRFTDFFFSNANGKCCNASCHGVVLVMFSLKCKIVDTHLHFFVSFRYVHLSLPDKSSAK